MPRPWSRDEVELIAADYFAMLEAWSSGRSVNKAERRRRLAFQLDDRSDASIEFKHANISAVLNLEGLPYIDGYKPRGHYQQLLEQVVRERLTVEPDFFDRLAESPIVQPEEPGAASLDDPLGLVEPPPEPFGDAGIQLGTVGPRRTPVPRKTDFVRLDAENRRLGRLGEEWAIEFEQRRLHDIVGQPAWAKQVTWVSRDEGDGAGYDIRSFNDDGTPRLIEVKTTGLAKYHPFYVSPNEVAVSAAQPEAYHLYRLFRFGVSPRLYMLRGALTDTCRLEPSQYSARVGR
jgi:hypothetical protein